MLSLGLESYYCLLLKKRPPELFAGAYAPSAWPLVATAAQELSSPRTPPCWLHYCIVPPPIASQNLEAFAATQDCQVASGS
jgi:hypothetical protein